MGCNCDKDDFSLSKATISLGNAIKSIAKTTFTQYDAFVKDEIKNSRLETCKSCEYWSIALGKPRCKICGCFLNYKTSLKDQSCPHPEGEKWPEEK